MPLRIASLVAVIWLTSVCGTSRGEPPAEATWKVGVAQTKITPERRLPMAGYAGRKEPAEGTEQDLYGKAIAIEDQAGNRVLWITLDLIGVNSQLRTAVTEKIAQAHKIPAASVLLNASHTHCGPAYTRDDAKDYFDSLQSSLVELGGRAVQALEPATLSYSHARASVAMNRRTPTESGFRNHPNPAGPVDHSVPVLSARRPDGTLFAVVFGYACHNTTMGFRRWLGDYAGYAQEYLQADHPGVTALFMMGCGGDQNPYPRSELKYAQLHGRTLATAVEAALEVNQRTTRHQHLVKGPLRAALQTVALEFADGREDFQYPVQVVRFGDDLTLVALGSEVVIDYALRLKGELAEKHGKAIWIAGYSNVYSGYIPSRRVLLEGGYEAQSRPWRPTLEERIVGKVHELVTELGQ